MATYPVWRGPAGRDGAATLPAGEEGQVMGFGADGMPVAVDLPTSTPTPTGLRVVDGVLFMDLSDGTSLEATLPAGGTNPPAQVAPAFTTRPSLIGSTALGGTITVDLGAASGTPAPTLTGSLARPGRAAAAVAHGSTFAIEAGDQGGTITLTATATNSAGTVTLPASLAVPAANAPAAQIGGIAVGAQGSAGTIYEGYRLAAGEDFATLDLLTASNPQGKYIASHRRRGRRAINAGANDYYWTQDHTGHNDANRGVAIGAESADLLTVAGSTLSLSTRLATTKEKQLAWATTASTGPQRPQSASALHSAGYQAVKWPCIVEARIRVPTGAQMPAGGWPAFWTEGIQPTWANTGEWDFEWTDSGRLFTNFITGNSSNDSIASQVVDTSDGEWHVWSIVATAAQLRFYKDGVLLNTATKRNDAHVPSPMFWWFRNGVDLTPSIFGMSYSASAWTGVTSKMDVDYVRLWSAPDATNLDYRGIVGQQNVAFDESISIRVPSKTELWGREDVTEILVWQPIENAEPGMTQLPVTAAGNTWYGSATAQNGQWGPSFMSWNPEYRQISGQGYDQAGRMVGHVVAWDDAKGGTAGFARVIVNIGPRITLPAQTVQPGPISAIDVYAACDCGMLTTDSSGARAKAITVTGLAGSGLSYDAATGMLTGTAVEGNYSAVITCTNSIGQSASATVAFAVRPAATGAPVADTFTAATDTELTSYVGESGAAWTMVLGTGLGALVSFGRLRANNTDNVSRMYARQIVLPDNQYAEGTLRRGSATSGATRVSPAVRISGVNAYWGQWDRATNVWNLFKSVNGTATSLGTAANTTTFGADGTTALVRVEANGTTIRMLVNGTPVITATDSSIVSGMGGVRVYGGGPGATGLELDNFIAGGL